MAEIRVNVGSGKHNLARMARSAATLRHNDVAHIESAHHRAADICAALRAAGLYVFEHAQDHPDGATVRARRLTPLKPKRPSGVGPVGQWES